MPEITISFSETSRKNVILQIEQISDYNFLFAEEWLSDELISGSYINTPLETVLQDIFLDTAINFFILDGRTVVLTRNSIIRDRLPQSFYRDPTLRAQPTALPEEVETTSVPYLEERPDGVANLETIRIGKVNRNLRQKRFTLRGKVSNQSTGEPIANLAIVVRGSTLGTSTNNGGFYTIELPAGASILQTKAIGIETVEKRVIMYNNGSLDFSLNESVEQLDEVIVESDITQNVEEVVTGVVKLDVEEIKTIPLVLGERDIFKTAITLPGITNAGEGSSGFNVRGGKTDQNLILLDEAVIYNPSHFFGVFSALNPFTAGDVTIYKGNIPSEYGGRLSSVFDYSTKDANTQKFAGEAAIGPVTSSLALEIPVVNEKSGILVGGRSTYSNWILRSLDDESLNNSEASFYDAIVKYNDKLDEKNSIAATGYFSKDAFSITSDSIYSYSNRLLSLKWSRRLNKKKRFECSAHQ